VVGVPSVLGAERKPKAWLGLDAALARAGPGERVVGRSPDATRQMASRGATPRAGRSCDPRAELVSQRKVVSELLAALRSSDREGVLAVLDPDVAVRGDQPGGGQKEPRGAAMLARCWPRER